PRPTPCLPLLTRTAGVAAATTRCSPSPSRRGCGSPELCGLACQDVQLGSGAHIRCQGKGRKQRSTPLTRSTAKVLAAWMRERASEPGDPPFPTSGGRALSRDAIALLVTKYATIAAVTCPTLRAKQVSPHPLRHTCAMNLLRSGTDPAVIALWL